MSALFRYILLLLAMLCAPAHLMSRVRGFNRMQLWLFAQGLAEMHARGQKLRYPGESLEIVAARVDLQAWIAADPRGALRHLTRRARGWRRHRTLRATPPRETPACADCVATGAAQAAPEIAVADTS